MANPEETISEPLRGSGSAPKTVEWPWRIGLVMDEGPFANELARRIEAAGGTLVFACRPEVSSLEVSNAVERERPDVLFVELSRTAKSAADWVADVRREEDRPLIVALHMTPDPTEMITALRAGASEFLCPPLDPGINEAMERIGALLEARQTKTTERGRAIGFLSAKGGCGATTIAGHMTAALQSVQPGAKVLLADLDLQTPATHRMLRREPKRYLPEALESVRRLSATTWRELATAAGPGVDILAASTDPRMTAPEPWRVESLFRFMTRQYNFVLADMGRNLNPSNYSYLPYLDEVVLVTAPDVLALYQTRAILQLLGNRGFDRNRIRIVLNRNLTSPQDFWVESIEQMFEVSIFGVLPNDYFTLEKLPQDRFEFPAKSGFGASMLKIAAKIARQHGAGTVKKAA